MYEALEISDVGGPYITVTLGPFESKLLHITSTVGVPLKGK